MGLVINEWLTNMPDNMPDNEAGCTAREAINFMENSSPAAIMDLHKDLYQRLGCPNEVALLRMMATLGLGAAAEAAATKKAAKCVVYKKRIRKTEKEPGQWVRGKLCGNCGLVFYCGTRCQTAHWRVHKKKCMRPVLPDSKQ